MPPADGTKIMPVGQRGANLGATWPAPLGMRRTERPCARAAASTRSIIARSNATGANRASVRRATDTPSAAAVLSTKAQVSRSARCSTSSSVLRRSIVITTWLGMTFTRLGRTVRWPTVATCAPP